MKIPSYADTITRLDRDPVDEARLDALIARMKQAVLLVIDVQKAYCAPGYRGTPQTVATTQRINEIAPRFNGVVQRTAWIYYDSDNVGPYRAAGGLYGVTPGEADALLAKNCDSAFRRAAMPPEAPTELTVFLEREKPKLLLACGFNLSACVLWTVFDALTRGHDVALLTDLTANDSDNYGDIRHFCDDHQRYFETYKEALLGDIGTPHTRQFLGSTVLGPRLGHLTLVRSEQILPPPPAVPPRLPPAL